MHRVFLRAPIIEKTFPPLARRDLSTSLSFPPSGCTNSHYTARRAAEFIMQKAFSVYITRKHKPRSPPLRKNQHPKWAARGLHRKFSNKKGSWGCLVWERERKRVGAARGWFALSLSAHFNFPRRGLLLKLSHLRDQHVQLAFSLVLVFLKQQK